MLDEPRHYYVDNGWRALAPDTYTKREHQVQAS
jgi:hypothetical protein